MVLLIASLLLSAAVDLATQLAASSDQPATHSGLALATTRKLRDIDRSGRWAQLEHGDDQAVDDAVLEGGGYMPPEEADKYEDRRQALLKLLKDQEADEYEDRRQALLELLKDQESHHEELHEETLVKGMTVLLLAVLQLVVILTQGAVGCVYKANVTDRRPERSELLAQAPLAAAPHGFTVGLFNCCDSGPHLLWSLCCMPLRQGDTYAAAGVTDFWNPYLLHVAIWVLTLALALVRPKSNSAIICVLAEVRILAGWRHRLRVALGAPRSTSIRGFDCFEDWLPLCFCKFCSVAQEAQQVDRGQGAKVGLCCSMELVGQPFLVAQGRQVAINSEMPTMA